MTGEAGRLLLLLPDLGYGGMQLQLLELARACAPRGRGTVVMAPDGPLGAAVREVAEHERTDWSAPRLETARSARRLLGAGGVAVMPADPALIHLVPALAAAGRLHLCLHNRPGTFEGWFNPATLERFLRLMPALAASRRVTFTAGSSPHAGEHARRLGLPPELISPWYPGVDAPPGHDDLSSGPIRQIAVVVRLSPEKLPIILAGAELAAAGLAAGARVRLVLHGDGPAEAVVRERLSAMLPPDGFHMAGPTGAPLDAVAAADVAVNAGRAAIEAMLVGRRVLTALVGPGTDGRLGPPVTPASFADLKERNFTWDEEPWEGARAWHALTRMTDEDVATVRDRARAELSSQALLDGHLAAIARTDPDHDPAPSLIEALADSALALEDAHAEVKATADHLWAARQSPRAAPADVQSSPPGEPGARRGPLRREVVAAVAGFALLAVVVYGAHVIRGGWYYDDWSFIARLDLAADGGAASLWRAAMDASYRPGYSVVLFAMYVIGRTGQAPYLVMGLAVAAAQGTLLLALLRRLGAELGIAIAAGAVLVVLPVIDATRLWMAAVPSGVAVALLLGGVLCALRGLEATGRTAAVGWHAVALGLYAFALLTSELLVSLLPLAVVLYACAADVPRALRRWPADLLVTGGTLAYIAQAASAVRPAEGSLGHLVERAGQVWEAGVPVFREQFPLDRVSWGPLGVLLLCGASAGLALAVMRDGAGAAARRDLVIASIGFAFMLAGLVMLLPAEPYYVPRNSGVGDRLSVAAAPGFATFLAGLAALLARGLAALAGRPQLRVATLAALALATVAEMSVKEIRGQTRWAQSWEQSQDVVGAVKRAVGPDLAPGARIITFRHATLLPGDVPVFSSSWDLRGAMRLTFRDPTIFAHPYVPGLLRCEPDALLVVGPPVTEVRRQLPYADLHFVDAATGTGRAIRGPRGCERALAEYGA